MPGISLTNPGSVTSLTLRPVAGSASKLEGVINLSKYTSLVKIDCAENDISAVSSNLNLNPALEEFIFNNNKLTGSAPNFSAAENSNCKIIKLEHNELSAPLPTTLPTGIQQFYANNNNFERDNNGTFPDFSNYTQLAVYNVIRQSDSYGVNKNTDGSAVTSSSGYLLNWSGPGLLANTSVDAADITGAIPESIRVMSFTQTNISKVAKRILLTQLYDTFKDKGIVSAGSFVSGRNYKIVTTGTTDFTTLSAADSNVDTTFTANGAGSGTGTARDMTNQWAKTTAVNGVTYSQPRIGVFSSHGVISKAADPPNAALPGAHHYLLGDTYGFGQSSETTNAAAIAKLVDVGFALTGF